MADGLSEPKFTPGPWLISQYDEHGGGCEIGVADFGLGCGLSGCKGDRYMLVSGAIDKHDAYLIAAAPDLYAALQALCECGGIDDGEDVFAKANAALAKARGETP